MTFDLDAARAKRREKAGDPFTFTVGGETFSLPPQTEWPITVGDALAEGKVTEAFALLVDPIPPGLTIGDLNDIMGAASQFFGVESLPNS